jgi:hypothetical protein
VLGWTGRSPPIYGLPLDGKGGRQLIRDTDQGRSTVTPRSTGPSGRCSSSVDLEQLQGGRRQQRRRRPERHRRCVTDRGLYLCQGGRDLSKAESWWDAILSYNAVQPYAQKVFEAANDTAAQPV